MLKIYHSSDASDFKMANGSIEGSHLVAYEAATGVEIIRWPISRMAASPAGSSRDLYQLTCPDQPDYTIFTRDPKVLNSLPPHLIQKKKDFTRWLLWVVAFSGIAFLILGFTLWSDNKDKWTESVAQMIPLEWEIKLGELLANQMIGVKSRQYTSQAKDLETLLKPLFEQSEKRYQSKIYIYIVDDPTPNAFALPGGHVVFHSGLLTKATSLEMIYGVAAHEFAHVIERHSMRSVVGGLSLFLIAQFLLGDFTGVVAVLVDNSQFLLQQMYSREAEAEADAVGVELLSSIQLSSRGLYEFFKLLENLKPSDDSNVPSALTFLSTHPPTQDRMEQMKARIDSQTPWLDTDLEKQQLWKELQSSLKL